MAEKDELRGKAEKRLSASREIPESLSPEEALRTLHELRVHQIELEMQNEELRRAQEELDAARTRYFDLYNLAPVGYCTLSEPGLILEANLTLATLLGTARGALAKQPLSRFILKEDQDTYYLHRKRLMETGEPQGFDLRMVKRDGTAFWVHLASTTSRDRNGEPVCRLVLSDITERKNLQESLDAARKLETMGIITGGVAHEVRNPLFAISTVSAALDKKFGDNPEIKPYVDHIREHVQRLSRLMDDLLVLGRPVETASFRPTALQEVIRKSMDQLSSGWPAMVEGCQVFLPEEAMEVEGSSDRLAQVFVNLLQNAFSYSDGSGGVRVGLHREKGWAVVTIRDRGPGIPPEMLPMLFRNYSTSRKGGTGLGLAIAEKIVAAHGGTIFASNNDPPPGACFTVSLPLGE